MTEWFPEYAKTRDVSVIIPSNLDLRLDRLKHSLNFLYRNGHQGEAIVGIWGGHGKIDALRSFCAALSPNIRIISQDGDLRPTARFQELADLTRGKYIVQTGDDDFLLPPTAQSLVNILEKDPSVFAAQGRILTITLDEDPIFGLGTLPLWPAPEHDLLTRFSRYCKHTGMTFHAMFRRADFIERYRWMDEAWAHTNIDVWLDGIGEYFTILKGRFLIIEEIFMLRGKHAANTSRIFRRDIPEQTFPFLLLSESFTPTYKFFESLVLRLFASVGVDIMEPETRKIIMTGLLDALNGGIFGRTDPPSPEDVRLKAILTQTPPHPVVTSVLTMVVGTKVAPATSNVR